MIDRWMQKAADRAEAIFSKHGVEMTLGGEPTFVPVKPEGAEWNYAAVGPTKLGYAWKVAHNLLENKMVGSPAFFCPGKLYPGEINPRWVLRILANRDGTPLFSLADAGKSLKTAAVRSFADRIRVCLGVPSYWQPFVDPRDPSSEVLAIPLDHDNGSWRSSRWSLAKEARVLSGAEGPAGLRLPLQRLPATASRRALSIERSGDAVAVFVPPLLQQPFLELLSAIEKSAAENKIGRLALQGYVPADEAGNWITLGFSADPGVLEINLPACSNWKDYSLWLETVTSSCHAVGLRPWKQSPEGTLKAREGETTYFAEEPRSNPIHFSLDLLGSLPFSASGNTTLPWLTFSPVLTSAHPLKRRARMSPRVICMTSRWAIPFWNRFPRGIIASSSMKRSAIFKLT